MTKEIARLIINKFMNAPAYEPDSDIDIDEAYSRCRAAIPIDHDKYYVNQLFELAVQYAIDNYDWAKARIELEQKQRSAKEVLESLENLCELSDDDQKLRLMIQSFADDLKTRLGIEEDL